LTFEVLLFINKTFSAELVLVRIREHPNLLQINTFKYRPISDNVPVVDRSDISNWRRPQDGKIRSFRLYTTPRYAHKNNKTILYK